MDQDVKDALERWRSAGLVDEDTIAAVRAFEHEREPVTASPRPPASPPSDGPPAPDEDDGVLPDGRAGLVAEGLAYLGAALAFGAGLVLFGELWVDLGGVARTMLAAAGTLAVGGAAASLGDPDTAAVRRLGALLAGLAVVGTALTVGVGLAELTDLDGELIALLAGVVGLATAIPVHIARERWPSVLAMGAMVVTIVIATTEVLDIGSEEVAVGASLAGLGLAWAALGWGGRVRPRTAFEVTGLLAGGTGVQMLAFDALPVAGLVIGVLVALAVLAVGLVEERTPPAVLGGLGITVFAPQLVFELFGETIGGPLALFVGGVTLVGVSILVLRQRGGS